MVSAVHSSCCREADAMPCDGQAECFCGELSCRVQSFNILIVHLQSTSTTGCLVLNAWLDLSKDVWCPATKAGKRLGANLILHEVTDWLHNWPVFYCSGCSTGQKGCVQEVVAWRDEGDMVPWVDVAADPVSAWTINSSSKSTNQTKSLIWSPIHRPWIVDISWVWICHDPAPSNTQSTTKG